LGCESSRFKEPQHCPHVYVAYLLQYLGSPQVVLVSNKYAGCHMIFYCTHQMNKQCARNRWTPPTILALGNTTSLPWYKNPRMPSQIDHAFEQLPYSRIYSLCVHTNPTPSGKVVWPVPRAVCVVFKKSAQPVFHLIVGRCMTDISLSKHAHTINEITPGTCECGTHGQNLCWHSDSWRPAICCKRGQFPGDARNARARRLWHPV
jgi:hypothetical protein